MSFFMIFKNYQNRMKKNFYLYNINRHYIIVNEITQIYPLLQVEVVLYYLLILFY